MKNLRKVTDFGKIQFYLIILVGLLLMSSTNLNAQTSYKTFSFKKYTVDDQTIFTDIVITVFSDGQIQFYSTINTKQDCNIEVIITFYDDGEDMIHRTTISGPCYKDESDVEGLFPDKWVAKNYSKINESIGDIIISKSY